MIGRVMTWLSLVAVVVAVVWLRRIGHEETTRWLAAMGGWAPVLATGLVAALVVTPGMMSDLFGLVNGTLFGPVIGAAVHWIGTVLGSVICYGVGRQIGRTEWVTRWLARLPPRLRDPGVSSLPFLLFVRYLPAIGGTLVNYSAGAFGVSPVRFLWTAALSTFPPSVFWAAVGYASRGS